MILRIVRGSVTTGRLDALTEEQLEPLRMRARTTPGLVRFHVAQRPRPDGRAVELVLVTFWESVDAALAAFEGNLAAARSLGGMDELANLDDVAYFEVDESQFRRSSTDAAILRLTVGRVARGLDAEIQQQLRERLDQLEPEMTEAYVGRRILGDDVEIAFISAWERRPPGRSLDAPFWPEISSRYDAFEVATYEPIMSGAAIG